MVSVTKATLIKRIELNDHCIAADMSRMLARAELPRAWATECVPYAWRWSNHPLADLDQDGWIELFRYAGYTHNFEPAALPTEQTVRLWRGSAHPDRMSWTTNRKRAQGFAIRNAGMDRDADGGEHEPQVWLAVVESTRLLAYVSFEQEYVIDPRGLTARQMPRAGARFGRVRQWFSSRFDPLNWSGGQRS